MDLRTRALRPALLLALVTLTGFGCAFGELRPHDPMGREFNLEEVQRQYTAYIRWNDFDKASAFVHPDVRDEFLAHAPDEDLRFTDYEVRPFTLDEKLANATIRVRYLAYRTSKPYEYKINEVQVWERDGNTWLVRPTFEGL